MLRKNVKSLLEQLQVCIFAKIVFGVRCTLSTAHAAKDVKYLDLPQAAQALFMTTQGTQYGVEL